MKKEKIAAFDFIRALCATGIVAFHYSYNYVEYGINGRFKFFLYGSGSYGALFVAIFFMLSGAVLWYNYGEKINVGNFYLKRFLSIFPMFYLAWFVMYLHQVKKFGTWLWAGPKKVFLYTVFGIDGYFLDPGYRMTYYTLGEWFLGAIVMLYALFPLLRLIFKHNILRYVFLAVITVLYALNLYMPWFRISDGKNMITCIMDFYLGMLIMQMYCALKEKYEGSRLEVIKKRLAVTVLVLGIIFMLLPVKMGETVSATVAGGLLFISFMILGEIPMKNRVVKLVCTKISEISFGVFLVHHVILYAFMKQFSGQEVSLIKSWGLFFAVYAIICLVGAALALWGKLVSRAVLKLISIKAD